MNCKSKEKYGIFNISKLRENIIFILALCFLMISRGNVSLIKTIFLALIQIVCVFIPGKAFIKQTKLDFENNTVLNLCSYAIGYVMSIILYIVLLVLGIQEFCGVIFAFYGIISFGVLYKTKNHDIETTKEIDHIDNIILCSCFMGAIILGIIIYLLPNRSAEIIGYNKQVGDLTYWFKNCVAATKSYPLPELSVNGLKLCWHLFSCFEIAFLHFTTGIEIYELCFTFSYVWKMLLLVGGVYVLASHFLKNRIYVLIAMLVTLFSSGLDTQTCVFYQYHLYRCSLAFEEGYAMSMYGFFIFMKFMDMKEKNIKAYILTIIALAGALGLKASGGTILLAGIGIRILLNYKKDWKSIIKNTLAGLSYVAVYIVINRLFIIDGNALTSSTSSHKMTLSLLGTLFRSGYYHPIYMTLRTGFLSRPIAYLVTIIIYIIQSNYAVYIPLIISILLTLIIGKWRNLFSVDTFTIAMMSTCGLGIFILFNHPGFSQVYFMFNTFAFYSILSMMLLERCECEYNLKNIKSFVVVVAFILIAQSCKYNFDNCDNIYRITPETYITYDKNEVSSGSGDVSAGEVEGLRWIRDNLPDNVVLATNKVLCDNPEASGISRSFITSEYTERQIYIEGFSSTNLPSMEYAMNRLVQTRNYYDGVVGAATVLRDAGVTHAVVFKGMQDSDIVLEGRCIYENDYIKVMSIEQ